jgi:hypothetical protein
MPPIEDSKQDFSEGDLASLGATPADDGGDGAGGDKAAETPPPADAAKDGVKPAEAAKDAAKPADKDAKAPLLAEGGDSDDAAKEKAKAEEKAKPYWPENWREKLAEHISAGDKKLYAKELKRLERIADPAGVYGMYREAEGKLTSGGLIKKPGKDAKPEEIAEYHKAMGVPEKPEDYFKDVKLENGAVIGEADKPLVDGFAAAVHKSGATPQFVNAALNWYYQNQEEQAAAMDEADDEYRRASNRELKDEYGPAFDRKLNATGSLFAKLAPGGLDPNNQNALYNRLLGGRMADGRIIGNDPDFNRFFIALAHEVVPAETVTEGGNQSGMSIDAEIKQIEGRMKDDRRAYYKDEAAQSRYRELITAREKIRARG